MQRILVLSLVSVLLLGVTTLVPVSIAAGQNGTCTLPNADTTPPFVDRCYHQGVWFSPDTAEIDLIIFPPVSPYELREWQLLEQSVDNWENGIRDLGAPWLSGLHINDYTFGRETVPAEAWWDPEVIVAVHAGLAPGTFAGAASQSPGLCHGQGFPAASLADPLHHHEDSPYASYRANCAGGGRVCVVTNAAELWVPDNGNRQTNFDLISHEVGHCLSLGHVGDATTENTDDSTAYPEHDIMSYESDGFVASSMHCPSNLNIRVIEKAFGYLLGQPGSTMAVAPNAAGYVNMYPQDWFSNECYQSDAAFDDTDYLTSIDPTSEDTDDSGGGEDGTPEMTITSPVASATVDATTLTVTGAVDRAGGSSGPPLAVDAGGPYSGAAGTAIAIAGTVLGGAGGHVCTWTGAGATFAAPNACSTTVSFASADGSPFTITLAASEAGYTGGTDTAQITVTGGNNPGTLIGTDAAGDRQTGCGTGAPAGCDLNRANGAYKGLDLRAAYVKDAGSAIRFTVEVDDASKFFVDPTPNPAGTGHMNNFVLSVSFEVVSPSFGLVRGTANIDRVTGVATPTGTLSQVTGVLSSTTPNAGPVTVDLANNRFSVDIQKSAINGFSQIGSLSALNAASSITTENGNVDSIVTFDLNLGTIASATWRPSTSLPELPADFIGPLSPQTAAALGQTGTSQSLYFHRATAPVGNADISLGGSTMNPTPPTQAQPAVTVIQNQFGGTGARSAYDAGWMYVGPVDLQDATVKVEWYASLAAGPTSQLDGVPWDLELYVYTGTAAPPTTLATPPGVPAAAATFVQPMSLTPTKNTGTFTGVTASGDHLIILIKPGFAIPSTLVSAGTILYDGVNHKSGMTVSSGPGQTFEAEAGGPYSGAANAATAISGSATGASGTVACTWTGAAATFANANACTTTVSFASDGSKTITLSATDGTDSDTDDATVNVGGADAEHVELFVDGVRSGGDVVVGPTDSGSPTDSWSGSVDLTGLDGTHTIRADWMDADDTLLASDSVAVTVAGAVTGELNILTPASGAELAPGTHTISGNVVPDGGPGDVAPDANIVEASQAGSTGATLTFTATASGSPAPACAWSFVSNLIGATFGATSCSGAQVTSTSAGSATVRLTATNSAGADEDTATATWTDEPVPLQVDIVQASQSGPAGTGLTFTSTVTGGSGTAVCTWTLAPSGPTKSADSCSGATFASSTPGTYTVALSVTKGSETDSDTAGASWTATGTHSVAIGSPTAGASVTQPFTLAGTATGTSDGDWLPSASGSLQIPSVSELDPAVRSAAGLFWPDWMDGVESDLRDSYPGFLGIVPNTWSGEPKVDAYFSGTAPTSLSLVARQLPDGLVLDVHDRTALQPLRQPLSASFSEHRTLLTADQLEVRQHVYGPVLPEDAPFWNIGIGPGSPTTQTIPNDGTYGCTANYVWKDQTGKLYLGLAGHCVLSAGADAALNSGGTFDTSGVTVDVCFSECITGGVSSGAEDFILGFGNYVRLGKVAYARQSFGTGGSGLLAAGDVGNDFALVEIPSALYHHIDPAMPVWSGPVDLNPMNPGTQGGLVTQIHGNSVGYGELFAGKSRLGVSLERQGQPGQPLGNQVWGNGNGPGGDSGYWMALMPGEMGDSGSAVNTLDPTDALLPGLDPGRGAGVLTHGIGPWNILTRLSKAVGMAESKGLCIALVPYDADPETFPAPPTSDNCEGDDRPAYDVQYSSDAGATWTSVDSFTPATGAWSASVGGLPAGPATLQVRLTQDGGVVATTSRNVVIAASVACGGGVGELVHDDSDSDATGGFDAGEVFCLGAHRTGDTIQIQALVKDKSDAPAAGLDTDFYYDFWFVPSWTGGTAGIWAYATWDGTTLGAVTWEDQDDPVSLIPLTTPLNTAEAEMRWDDANPNLLLLEFPLSNFASAPGPGDGFTGMAVGPNTFNSVEGSVYLDCSPGDTSSNCEDRDGTYQVAASASLSGIRLPTTWAFGPQVGAAGERVELYVDGNYAGEATVETSGGATDTWSVNAVLTAGDRTITAEWFDGSRLVASDAITVTVRAPDRDGDGVADEDDAFPDDPSEWADSDGDGVGDNADLCAGSDDAIDVDVDGIPDGCDALIDSDGDGVADDLDSCPGFDDGADVDGDGTADGCDANPNDGPMGDVDGDGVANFFDNCPLDANDQADLDGDGFGDACDSDRDGDGVPNADDAFPDNAAESADSDGDGVGNNADACAGHDDATDLDGDGVADGCDADRDGDGYSNDQETSQGSNPDSASSVPDNKWTMSECDSWHAQHPGNPNGPRACRED